MKKLLRGMVILIILGLSGYHYYTNYIHPTLKIDIVAEKCLQQSGIIDSYTGQYNNAVKLCHLPDGTICELLALSRGECPIKEEQKTGGSSVYIPTLGIVLNHPKVYNMIELPHTGTMVSYNISFPSLNGSKTVFIGGVGATGRLYINEFPYHERKDVFNIEDVTITEAQKDEFIKNGICPRKDRSCRHKKIGNYDIMYAYGMTHPKPEGTYFDAHFFILGTGSFFILDDGWMDTLIQNERKEEKSLTKQLLKQRFEEHIGTISEPIFYGHALMDSIRGPRD